MQDHSSGSDFRPLNLLAAPYLFIHVTEASAAASEQNATLAGGLIFLNMISPVDWLLQQSSDIEGNSMRQLSAYGIALSPDYRSSKDINVSGDFLSVILSAVVSLIPIDDEWYRSNNPDFYAAELKDIFTGPREHYVRYGFVENRMPHPIIVDPDFYMSLYPDIEKRFKEGSIASLQEHFNMYGFKEGRQPYENWSLLNPISFE